MQQDENLNKWCMRFSMLAIKYLKSFYKFSKPLSINVNVL